MSDNVKELLARARLAVSEVCDACQSQDGPAYASLTRLHDQLGIMLESNTITFNDYIHQVLLSPTQSRTDDTTSKIPWIRKFNGSMIKIAQGLRAADPQDGVPSTQEIVDVIEDYRTRFATMADAQRMQDADAVLQHLSSMSENVLHVETKINELLTAAMRTTRDVVHKKLDPLTRATLISYNAPSGCLADTRVNVLRQLTAWVDDQHTTPCLSLLWLSGMAGAGKTAIARTFADRMEDENMLGAAFFIDPQDDQRRDPKRIVQTLAYYLLENDRHGLEALSRSLEDQPDIKDMQLPIQVGRLIRRPLAETPPVQRSRVIVIDALDECKGSEGIELIATLLENLSKLPIKLLVTSRNEVDRDISGSLTPATLATLRLQEVKDEDLVGDLRLYYDFCYRDIASRLDYDACSRLLKNLPSLLDELVGRTGSLFIYAATIVQIVKESDDDPLKVSRELLELSMFSSPYTTHGLDNIYRHVVEKAIHNDRGILDKQRLLIIRKILEFMVCTVEPVSLQALARLLVINEIPLVKSLERLSTVLLVDKNATGYIRPFHQSFVDFLREDDRNAEHSSLDLQLKWQQANANMANFCLSRLNKNSALGPNMCGIRDPSLENTAVSDLQFTASQKFPSEVQYALRQWPYHMANSGQLSIPSLQTFCEQHVLHWIEAASILRCVPLIRRSLSAMLESLQTYSNKTDQLHNFEMILSDARDLLQQYGAVIVNRALHVYHSAEVFMAQCTLSEQYSSSKSALQSFKTARLRSPRPRQWDGHEVLLTGLDGAVSHMAFSHDDMHLAATLKDGNVCIWSLVTQSVVSRSVQTLNVLSASFMPRSAGLICREQHQIVIRDISPLDVLSVAFTSSEVATTCMASSPDALHLSVGLQDGRVLFWSTANLATFSTLHFHDTPISCISFSTDSTSMASACSAGAIAVWNVRAVEDTPYTLHPQEDQDIKHISFSSDGSCILYLSCLNPGLISDISMNNAQDEDIWIAGEELEYISGGSEDESKDIFEDGGGRASETGEDDMIERRWEDVTEDGIADGLETAPDKMRTYFWYFRRAQDQEERQDVIPSSHCLLYRDFCFFVRRDGLLSTSIVYLRSLENRDGHDFQRLDAGKHISAIGTSSSAALLACSHPDAGVVQVFNIEHYWKTNQGSRIMLATRIIHAIMSPDGSRFAYISEDANGARIHTHSTTGSRHWSVAVTNTYDRDNPIENMIQLLGLTNIGALKDLVVIRRCVHKMEIWGSSGLVQRMTDIDMAEKVMCPNDGQHLVLIREGFDDEHGQDMDIWHIPSSDIVASNLCHVDDPSHIGLGGSKLVYRRRPHIYFRDLADNVESELILSPRMAYPCFAVSPRGDAVAVCQLNGDQWDIEIWNMRDIPVGIVKILPSCLSPLYDVRFMHDRINLCLTFGNGESHITHHNVPMRTVKRLNMTPIEPIVFVNWNGWVTYTVPGRSELRKVCWIPRHLLPNDSATLTIRGSLVVIEGDDVERQNVIFDVLPAIEYLESLKK